ncbi:MAG: LTA synthase family protein [bacterium]|nr:LTA synthase family protein [bacterium]
MTDLEQDRPHSEESELPAAIWFVPILLAAILPGLLWTVAERPMATKPSLGITMSAIVLLVGLLLLAGLSRGFRSRLRWSASVTTMIVLVLFQWPSLSGVGRVVASALRVSILSDAFPVLLAGAFLWTAIRLGGEWRFVAIVGVPLLVLCAALFLNTQSRVAAGPTNSETRPTAADSPDVVLLILDGYTRDDVLAKDFGFDNSPFLAELESLGFNVAPQAHSNYNYTYAAISTMFNLDYVFDVGEISDADLGAMRNALAGDANLFETFHQSGYEVAYTENFWSGSNCGGAVDHCWRTGGTRSALWSLGRMTIMAPLLRHVQPHPFHTVSVDHLADLPEIVQHDRTDEVPRLTIAHVILPHQPLLLDAKCDRQTGPSRNSLTNSNPDHVELRKGHYVDQMICTNTMVIDALAQIIETRPDTIVMITADHGFDSGRVSGVSGPWSDSEISERMSILSAYRLPDCAGFYEAITPVNGVRNVANCAVDAGLEQLPDRHLWVPAEFSGIVSDIDSRLDG